MLAGRPSVRVRAVRGLGEIAPVFVSEGGLEHPPGGTSRTGDPSPVQANTTRVGRARISQAKEAAAPACPTGPGM